jgi:RNA polymerase sigma factor (sigma-70 family)
MVQSDTELIAACRRGDAEAWQTLVARYQRLIYTIPVRGGLDEEQAAEVFQTVFTRLVEHLPRLEQPDRLQAWLVTTAKRETWRLTRRGRQAAAAVSIDDEDSQELPDNVPLPQEVVQKLEEQHMVRMALERLENPCRTLLSALFYQENPPAYSELAASLGIPTGSIGPTRARCLQKLRSLLDKMGF